MGIKKIYIKKNLSESPLLPPCTQCHLQIQIASNFQQHCFFFLLHQTKKRKKQRRKERKKDTAEYLTFSPVRHTSGHKHRWNSFSFRTWHNFKSCLFLLSHIKSGRVWGLNVCTWKAAAFISWQTVYLRRESPLPDILPLHFPFWPAPLNVKRPRRIRDPPPRS